MKFDIYTLMITLEDSFEKCKTEDEIDKLAEYLKCQIESKRILSKEYLKMGIL